MPIRNSATTLKTPEANTIIWRYMNFEKLIALLETRTLSFCRLDLFSDKFEGFFSAPTINSPDLNLPETMKKALPTGSKQDRSKTFVNCWTINKFECNLLWNTYLENAKGVAVQSTFKNVCDSFAEHKEHIIDPGIVEYLDYEIDLMELNALKCSCSKQKFYESENELRFIIYSPEISDDTRGIPVQTDLSKLIEHIVISPFASTSFKESAKIIIEKYGFGSKIKKSRLEDNLPY